MDERMTSVLGLRKRVGGEWGCKQSQVCLLKTLYSCCSIRSWLEAKFHCALYSSPQRESFPFGGEE